MDTVLYLLQLTQSLSQQNCWFAKLLVTDFRQDWNYKDLIPYFENRYGKKIRPVSRHSECDIPDHCGNALVPKKARKRFYYIQQRIFSTMYHSAVY